MNIDDRIWDIIKRLDKCGEDARALSYSEDQKILMTYSIQFLDSEIKKAIDMLSGAAMKTILHNEKEAAENAIKCKECGKPKGSK